MAGTILIKYTPYLIQGAVSSQVQGKRIGVEYFCFPGSMFDVNGGSRAERQLLAASPDDEGDNIQPGVPVKCFSLTGLLLTGMLFGGAALRQTGYYCSYGGLKYVSEFALN